MLGHPDPDIVRAAVRGEWLDAPAGSVRPGLQAAWRAAALRCRDGVPKEAFQANPALARDWLEARFQEDGDVLWWENETSLAAYAALNNSHRQYLLDRVPEARWTGEVVRNLVDDDADLYRHLLANANLKAHHLKPLQSYPEGTWVAKALCALDAGYSPEDLAEVVHGGTRCWVGEESGRWAEWVERFKALCSHSDPRIQRIGEFGREHAQRRLDQARRQERHEAIYGDG